MAFRRSQRSGGGSQRMRASGGIAISRSQSSDGFGSDSGPSRGDSVGSLSARRRHPPPRSARSASRRLRPLASRNQLSFRDRRCTEARIGTTAFGTNSGLLREAPRARSAMDAVASLNC